MRYAVHRKDANEKAIVSALEKIGVKVQKLGGKGIPDLLVGHRQRLVLFELKDGAKKPSARKLRPGQKEFAEKWAGYPIFKVETLADAFAALGIEVAG